MDQAAFLNHGTNLSAEVEPFIPRSDVGNMMAEHMIPQASQGPLPHYLTSCYPFVQDQAAAENAHQGGDELDYANLYNNREMRLWSQIHAAQNHPQFQQLNLAPPNRFSAPPTNLTNQSAQSTPVYTYHAGPQFHYNGFSEAGYHPQIPGANLQQAAPSSKMTHGKRESSSRRSADRKQSANKKGHRSVGIQMEVQKTDNGKDETTKEMVDHSQQTDFPSEIASKTLVEKPSPLKKMTRSNRKWRRAVTTSNNSASCDSSDNNGDEADVDSDSGYYSPKHQISRRTHAPPSSSSGIVQEDRHEIGTAIHPNYSTNDLSPQRLLYHPTTFYQVHPGSYLSAPTAPGQIIRLPTPGTPPMIMTPPPPVMNLAQGTLGQHNRAIAVANFKSRSIWEQEILKAHNVAPICPPAFVPRQSAPYGQHRNRTGGQHNWRYPRFQNHMQKRDPPGSPNYRGPNSPKIQRTGQGGILKLHSGTAPQHFIHQTPPQLTEEDFPDLQPSIGSAGSNGHPLSAFSYSAALQNKPKPASEIDISEDSPIKSLIDPDDSGPGKGSRRRRKKTERAAKAAAEEYAGISKEQENIKKQLNKKATKSKTPQLDLAAMLSKLEKTQAEVAGSHGILKHHPSQYDAYKQRTGQNLDCLHPHNPLDSSAPLKKRGKEREIPKSKKPSALKKVILKEREEKKNTRLTHLMNDDAPEFDVPPIPSDYFKTEHPQKETAPDNDLSDGVSTLEAHSSGNQSPAPVSVSENSSPVVPGNVPKIHSRRYREYCSGQVLDKQIDEECIVMLQKLVQFQERMYQKDPIKAKSKRRFVLGIREVTKHLKLKKLCCVLISPNLEKIQSKGGLDDALQQIIQLCKAQSVPYVFALGRCAMGRAVSKLVPVSIIGIFDYSGAEESFKKMLDLVQEAQKKYHEMMVMYQQEITEATATPPAAPPVPAKRIPAHMGHSRNPSAASCVSFCSMISEPISEMPDGTSWRNMMDVGDEPNPAPALSPPPETPQEDDAENETSSEVTKPKLEEETLAKDEEKDDSSVQDEYEDAPSNGNEDSYLNAVNNSGSLTSEEQQNPIDPHQESFSTVSTVVAAQHAKDRTTTDKGNPPTSKLPGSSARIPNIMEGALPSSSDTADRINSWLASSVGDLEIADPPSSEEKLDRIDEDQQDEEDDDDFVSTHEDEVEESQQ